MKKERIMKMARPKESVIDYYYDQEAYSKAIDAHIAANNLWGYFAEHYKAYRPGMCDGIQREEAIETYHLRKKRLLQALEAYINAVETLEYRA